MIKRWRLVVNSEKFNYQFAIHIVLISFELLFRFYDDLALVLEVSLLHVLFINLK